MKIVHTYFAETTLPPSQLQIALHVYYDIERQICSLFPTLARIASVLCDIILLSGRAGTKLPKLILNDTAVESFREWQEEFVALICRHLKVNKGGNFGLAG